MGERTGIGHAASELLSALTQELPENWKLRVLVNSARHSPPAQDAWVHAPDVEIRHTKVPGRLLLRGWQYLRVPPIEMLLGSIDLYHSPASYIAPAIKAKRVITVHDLFFHQCIEDNDLFGGAYFAKTFPRGLRRCDRIIAISEFTRKELVAAYHLDPGKISVVPLGVNTRVFTLADRTGDAEIIEQLAQSMPYLLCVATVGKKRKNLTGLLEAYARARSLDGEIPGLLIVGLIEAGSAQSDFEDAISRLDLNRCVRQTGYVPPGHLPALYRHARCLVVPSLYEGFGLPMLEAMACGCPVLASTAGALPETAGDAAVLVNIGSIEETARGMLRICRDASLRESLKQAGLERVKGFSWTSTARATLAVYSEVMERTRSGAPSA